MTVADGFVVVASKEELEPSSTMVSDGSELEAPVAAPTAPKSCEKLDSTFVPESANGSFSCGAASPELSANAPELAIAPAHTTATSAVAPALAPTAMRRRTCSGFCFRRAMVLKGDDRIVSAEIVRAEDKNASLLIIMENGYGKKTPLTEYKIQGRGGSGIKTADVTAKTGEIIGATVLVGEESKEEELVLISKKGQVIRISAAEIPSLSRATQGVRVMKMREGDSIASMVAL